MSDSRLWIVYVDAEVTLRGFETFLRQYRRVLGAVCSGVIYASPAPWSGPVQRVFDKVIVGNEAQCQDPAGFRDYCGLRARIEANEWAAISVADLQRYRIHDSAFQTASFDALYQRWRQAPDASVTSVEVATARRLDCVLRIHPLGDRYGVRRRTKAALRG
jgi:hypothetical protein